MREFFFQVCSLFLAPDIVLNRLQSGTAKTNGHLQSSFSRVCLPKAVKCKTILPGHAWHGLCFLKQLLMSESLDLAGDQEAKKRKVLKENECFMRQFTVLPAASRSAISVRRALLLVCLPGSPVQPGELTVLFRDSQGQRWKNRKSRDYWVSLNPAAWVDRAGRSPQSRQDKKVSSTGLEEPGPISRAWC